MVEGEERKKRVVVAVGKDEVGFLSSLQKERKGLFF